MGYCNECGAPCPHCTPRTEFSLLVLDESLRGDIKSLLDDVGCNTEQRQSALVQFIQQYESEVVRRSLRIWKNGGYVLEGKDERYFMGIVKKQAIAKQPRLDDLPPEYED